MGGVTAIASATANPVSESAAQTSGQELSPEQRREVEQLRQRDREVRQHEQAHVAAGGQYVRGGPRYEFTTGPDGRRYVTGGSVDIDVSPERTPEATIVKAQVVRRAALAPAQPSPQDRAIAAQASAMEQDARREIAARDRKQETGSTGPAVPSPFSGQRLDVLV